jgi:acetylornithine deacetylase/succinyl-diaminopimelate desuccinylase-like protein
MKVKLLAVLLLTITTIVAVLTATLKSTAENNKKATTTPIASADTARQQPADPPGTIDGAKNPELIPDSVAYTMLFRVVGGRQTEEERNSIRSYLRQAGFGCRACTGTPTAAEEAEINAVIAIADEFWQRMDVLDNQVKEIKDRTWPNPGPEVMTQLGQLQRQNEAITAEIIGSLPRRLGPASMEKLRHHINETVKRNTKTWPEPNSFPGGPDWYPSAPPHQH